LPGLTLRRGTVALSFVFLVVLLLLGFKVLNTASPTIALKGQVKGIGQSTLIAFEVRDPKYQLKSLRVEVRQGGQAYQIPYTGQVLTGRRPHWWSTTQGFDAGMTTHVGRKQIPTLREGTATLHITAINNSWGRFFRGGKSEIWRGLPVRFAPPRVEVLTTQHYINQGGCDMVLFKVSPGTAESGVQVGDYFFPSWPVKDSMPETRMCVFAYPYNVDPKKPARVVARDDAGNETLANFTYEVFPKKFHSDTINLTDEFLSRIVPPIMSQSPEVDDQGSVLKNFLEINGHLREVDAQKLLALSKKTASHFLWSEPFVQLGNSKVEASFADYRTYVYSSREVDRQTHLGFDLAVNQHTPVVAANDGVVVHAGWLDIFGNAIVLDHGCGLQTLYGHLSGIDVKVGDTVKRGQIIGHSGQTGLAAGDHLHFAVLLDGIPVSTIEWWDPHWIRDRIQAKLAAYR